MAKPKPAAEEKKVVDWSKFTPEGTKQDDFVQLFGLTPIYSSEHALENNWDPVTGHLVSYEEIKMAEPNPRIPGDTGVRDFFRVEIDRACKAVKGNKTAGHDVVDLKPGDEVLVPVGGNLSTMRALKAAALDPKRVHYVGFAVIGTLPMGSGKNDMWEIDARILQGKTIPREGRHLLGFETAAAGIAQLGAGGAGNGVAQTVDGQTYNKQTGELRS